MSIVAEGVFLVMFATKLRIVIAAALVLGVAGLGAAQGPSGAAGVDRHGDPLTISGSGFLARALQHETDHLAGRLYVDTLRGDIRRKALREIRAGRVDSPSRHR